MLEMKKDMMGREIVEANPSEAEEKEVKRKIEELKPAVESAKKERVAWFNLRGSLRKGWDFGYDDHTWEMLVDDFRYCWLVVSSLAFFIGKSNDDNWEHYLGHEAFGLMSSAQKSYLTAKKHFESAFEYLGEMT